MVWPIQQSVLTVKSRQLLVKRHVHNAHREKIAQTRPQRRTVQLGHTVRPDLNRAQPVLQVRKLTDHYFKTWIQNSDGNIYEACCVTISLIEFSFKIYFLVQQDVQVNIVIKILFNIKQFLQCYINLCNSILIITWN